MSVVVDSLSSEIPDGERDSVVSCEIRFIPGGDVDSVSDLLTGRLSRL